MAQAIKTAPNVEFTDAAPAQDDSHSELIRGLSQAQKSIDPKWFYDEQGSELFEHITQLPEYYPTRTEISILRRNQQEIAALCGPSCVFIEPGSGNCEKARLLFDALRPAAYVPVDISADFLRDAATRLGLEYPWMTVHAVCSDFSDDWTFLDNLPPGKRVVFYPGSTIGNLAPHKARAFLQRVRRVIGDDGGLLLGVDLHKSSERLNAAYNDASGVTARFNLNVLNQVNDALDADFDAAAFEHNAFYDENKRRIEMHLVSKVDQSVRYSGGQIALAAGESIHTENSYKYSVESFAELAASAGLGIVNTWVDDEQLFSVHYLSTG